MDDVEFRNEVLSVLDDILYAVDAIDMKVNSLNDCDYPDELSEYRTACDSLSRLREKLED